MKKGQWLTILAGIMLILLGWWVKTVLFSSPVPPGPAAEVPSPAVPVENSQTVSPAASKERGIPSETEKIPLESQRLNPAKTNAGGSDVSLEDYSYSIQREKAKELTIAPGVTVSNNAIHIKAHPDSDKSIEIERHPANTNNEYQVLWKSKF